MDQHRLDVDRSPSIDERKRVSPLSPDDAAPVTLWVDCRLPQTIDKGGPPRIVLAGVRDVELRRSIRRSANAEIFPVVVGRASYEKPAESAARGVSCKQKWWVA